MGAWGTAISSNDTYADIYAEFFELYNDGLNVGTITDQLIKQHQDTIEDQDDANNFWFALARAQWECKQLDDAIFDKVKQIIESGADLEVWRGLEANEKDLKKRQVVLDKFLLELQSEKPKAKSRRKKKVRQPVFGKGDCFAFRFDDGNYGGAIALEAIYDTEYGHNLIAALRLNQSTKPTLDDFQSSEIAFLNFASWKDAPNVFWYYPIRYKLVADKFESVGKIEITQTYSLDGSEYFHCAELETYLISNLQKQFEFEKSNPKPSEVLKAKELTKKNKWKFW